MAVTSPLPFLQSSKHVSHMVPSWQAVVHLLYALVPQFFRTNYFGDPIPSPRVSPTSWLDGLKGLASVGVISYHYTYAFNQFMSYPAGTTGEPGILSLPIIRLLFSGLPMVQIFFIAAGYSVSLKPLLLMSKGTSQLRGELMTSLASSAFRRWFRLYLPTIASMFLMFLLVRTSWIEITMPLIRDPTTYLGWRERRVRLQDSLGKQFISLWYDVLHLCNIFQPVAATSYDVHLWSIMPLYRGSLAVYLSLLPLVVVKSIWRLPILIVISLLIMPSGCSDMTVFLWGAAIAQVDVLMRERDKSSTLDPLVNVGEPGSTSTLLTAEYDLEKHSLEDSVSTPPQRSLLRDCIPRPRITRGYLLINLPLTVAFFLGLILLSTPARRYQSMRLYAPFLFLIPSWFGNENRALPSIGAALLTLTLCVYGQNRNGVIGLTKRVLSTPQALYLGRIGFAIYLVHGIVLHSVGYLVPLGVWWIFGFRGEGVPAGMLAKDSEQAEAAHIGYGVPASNIQYVLGIGVGWIVSIGLALCVADIFAREVEARTVRFTKWIEGFIFLKTPQQEVDR